MHADLLEAHARYLADPEHLADPDQLASLLVVVDRNARSLARRMNKRLQPEDVEEIASAVTARFWQSLSSLDPMRNLATFLAVSVRNEVIDRNRQTGHITNLAYAADPSTEQPYGERTDSYSRLLEVTQRSAITKKQIDLFLEGCTVAEVAERTQIAETWLRAEIKKVRRQNGKIISDVRTYK